MLANLIRRLLDSGKGEGETKIAPESIKPCYQLGQQIGKGSFSEVRMITSSDQNGNKNKLAVKIIEKSDSPSTNKVVVCEVKALRKLSHPNLIRFQEVLRKENKFYIIMEYAEGGDLFQKLDKHGAIPDPEARHIFSGIISGLHYCHNQCMAHRDLKLENILLDKNNRPKISDFGFSRSCVDENSKRILSQTYCGSLYYASPEILLGTPYNPTMADMWSVGVILYAMVFNAMPFMEKDVKMLVRKELKREISFPDSLKVVPSCIEVIKWLVEPDVLRRATTTRVITASRWLREDK